MAINNYIEFYNYERIMVKLKSPPAYAYLDFNLWKKNSNFVEVSL
ncbi:IS3 family transposase [Spiroplasma apis]